MSLLRVASAQYPISRHGSFEQWKQHSQKWIDEAVKNKAQVLVFPEYGYLELVSLLGPEIQKDLPKQVQQLQKFNDDFLQFFAHQAKKNKVAILAPSLLLALEEYALPVNRAYFFKSDGSYDFQDKEHMTRFEDEDLLVQGSSTGRKTFEAFGCLFGVSICFDVEFPYAAHELAKKGVQVLLAPACTESMKGLNRVHIGARARAMENQFYVVVAQVVEDSDWSFALDFNTGLSAVYSTCDNGFPDDGILAQGEPNKQQWVYADLDLSLIEKVRTSGQVFNYKEMLAESSN